MKNEMKEIFDKLPEYQTKIDSLRDIILTNLIMLGEIPAPTFKEQNKRDFLLSRFNEYELLNCSTDEKDNGLGILPGETGEKTILVTAHMDTIFPENIDHTINIEKNKVFGPAVGDNALGLAVVASLPLILEHLKIKLNSDLILMGSSQSLGRGDLEGLRFFLNNNEKKIDAGVCVEGVKLGRLSYSSIGMFRGEISFSVPEAYDWTRFGASGAIISLNDLLSKILEIPIPKKPLTNIVLGSVRGGNSFNTVSSKAKLQFEIRSESADMVETLTEKIRFISDEISAKSGSEVYFDEIAKRTPGGIDFSHPLTSVGRSLLGQLHIKPRLSPSTSELSAFIDCGIPAITIGLTNGEDMAEEYSSIDIDPISKGVAQLVALIVAIDKGYCYEVK